LPFKLVSYHDESYPPRCSYKLIGSDTTTGVLILTIYHLLVNQDVYEKLTKELDEYYQLHEQEINVTSVLKLPYLAAVIQEGLRLGTPFPGLARVIPEEGATICGSYIPGGTIVSVPAYAHQTSKRNFSPEPLSFRPERWLPGGLGPDSVLDSSAVICFSSGIQST
jgi:cytochrome P450